MKNVDSKKLAGTIIGGIAFIFCLIFFTYAWYEWRSNNTELSGEITDNAKVDITLDNDGDISSNDIGPVLNIEDGVIGGFSADNKDVYPGHLYIDLKINRIDSELLSEDLKYIIVKSIVSPRTDDTINKSTLTYDYDNPVASGDFSNFKVATNLLGEDNVQAQSITFYKVIIYIDGSVQNNTNLQGKSIDAKLIITDTEIKYLNEVPVGSYVAYVGNNGCEGDSCKGVNANYEKGVTNGYCSTSSYGFNSSGWRVAYTSEGNTHIVSAGAPECMCTNSDGSMSNNYCDNSETTGGNPLHIKNLNTQALKYCNTDYSNNGVCDSETTWNINDNDYNQMIGNSLNLCYSNINETCGYNNKLIDNGGFYLFATALSSSTYGIYTWSPDQRGVFSTYSNFVYGVRPVIKLDKNIVVTGGQGTEDSPYKIEKIEETKVTAATYIASLYNSSRATTVNIGGDTSKPTVSLDEESNIMLDNNGEYRYYGSSPNNYVDFNGELWRIISVSKVFSSEEDTTGETRVRIIKDTPIGNYAWDNDDYKNNWADATLMCQLNTMYYNDTIQACTGKSLDSLNASLNTEAKSLIDNALWYLGGGDNPDLYADDYYTMERGTAVADSSYPSRWTGKLGLMYPSDYAYAADLSLCKNTGYNYVDMSSYAPDPNCAGTDWLFNSDYQWLMTPYSGISDGAWVVIGTGFVYGAFDVYLVDEFGVRPLAVLKSNVIKTGGDGSSGNPYTLAIN